MFGLNPVYENEGSKAEDADVFESPPEDVPKNSKAPSRVKIKHITENFKGKDLYSFEGVRKHQLGTIFLERIDGAIFDHEDTELRNLVDPDEEGPFNSEHNRVLYEALVMLTEKSALVIVRKTKYDGRASYFSLRTAIQPAHDAEISNLRKRISDFRIDANMNPMISGTMLLEICRELSELVPYDDKFIIADVKHALSKDYALVLATNHEETDISRLMGAVEHHYLLQSKDPGRSSP